MSVIFDNLRNHLRFLGDFRKVSDGFGIFEFFVAAQVLKVFERIREFSKVFRIFESLPGISRGLFFAQIS